LLRRYTQPTQAHTIGFLPELTKTLQGANRAPALYIQIECASRHLGQFQRGNALSPVIDVARLFLISRFHEILPSRRCQCEPAAARASSSLAYVLITSFRRVRAKICW